jgi:hypothetical protein
MYKVMQACFWGPGTRRVRAVAVRPVRLQGWLLALVPGLAPAIMDLMPFQPSPAGTCERPGRVTS